MSELAFNQNGDLFDVPAVVTGWRVRRLKPRGAPELVYGRDGRPLTIPIEADMNELRHAVGGVLGKYRLDPIDDDGKIVEGTPPAYIQVVKPEPVAEAAATVATRDDGDSAIREAMRLNTELAKSIVDRFPEMMQAAAELLRAADGAGLPARQPRVIDVEDGEDDEDEVRDTRGDALNNLVAQVVPMLVTALCGGKLDLASVLDWRKAQPQAACAKQTARASKELPTPVQAKDSTVQAHAREPAASDAALPPLDPQTMAHVVAIQSALTPQEIALVQEVAKDLGAAELRAWFDELSKLSVNDAVAKIRALVAGKQEGGAS